MTQPMTATRTDEEVLCEFMEARPNHKRVNRYQTCDWWVWLDLHRESLSPDIHEWIPRHLDLDALREIEEQLTEEQRYAYFSALMPVWAVDDSLRTQAFKDLFWLSVNASAAHKIKALATVVKEKP